MINKIILAICAVVIYNVTFSDNDSKEEKAKTEKIVTSEQKETLRRLIVANDYPCVYASRAMQSSYDGKWRVYCGEESAYNIEKENNFWKVTKVY